MQNAEEVISLSPRIFRTNSPRVLRHSPKPPTPPTTPRTPVSQGTPSTPSPGSFRRGSITNTLTRSRSGSAPVPAPLLQPQSLPRSIPSINDFDIIKPITSGGFA